MKLFVGLFIMERSTAERGNPYSFSVLRIRGKKLPESPKGRPLFPKRDGKGVKDMRVQCQCKGGKWG